MASRIAVILTARPSWAKLEPVCRALKARPDVELQIIACASALLERYGKVVDVVRSQGYEIAAEIYSVYEGTNLVTSAKESGALVASLADGLSRLRPDVGVVCADRHEVLAAATALAQLHLPVVHLQGGERSGSIDDRCRDAITALSDVHCVATEHARFRVYSLTGSRDIYQTGCPSIDLAKQALSGPPVTCDELQGTGPALDLQQPFLLLAQHPVTNEMEQAASQMRTTLDAIGGINLPSVLVWSGQDAGSDAMAHAVREWRHTHPSYPLVTIKNLPPVRFLKLMTQCAVMVGNSSAGIRESSFLGTPVVDIGTRQWGRERADNVVHVYHDAQKIRAAIDWQAAHGRYQSSTLYGTGNAGEQIAEVIYGVRQFVGVSHL